MVKYQFEIDDDKWNRWKDTVPRSKALDVRLIELIEADTEGRIGAADPTSEPQTDTVTAPSPEPQSVAPLSDSARERLRDELAGSGDQLEARVDAIESMYQLLRDRGEAQKDELLDAVDVEDTGYASRASVWANMVKGKETLSALPGVESPPTGRSEWRYVDE